MLNSFFIRCFILILCFYAPVQGWSRTEKAVPAPASRGKDVLADRAKHCLVDFYFTPGCKECDYVENRFLPQLRDIFGEQVIIKKHNLYDTGEFVNLRNFSPGDKIIGKDNVFFIIDGKIYIGGKKDIELNLIPAIEERLYALAGFTESFRASGVEKTPAIDPDYGSGLFRFSVFTVIIAGLIDGLNPCAFATLIFLVSVLLLGGGQKSGLIWLGAGFCSAVYLAYFLIGLGLFQAFRLSLAWQRLSAFLHLFLMAALLLMAVISFRDAWIFSVTGRQGDVILKLPEKFNRLIHHIIRSNLNTGHGAASRGYVFFGGLLVGFCVTLLESVCTGQLYAPTLAFLAWTSELWLTAFSLLALYNLMFVLPLIVVFILAWRGTGSTAFIVWSRKHVVFSKCLSGIFFVFLAVVLYLFQSF